MKSDNNVLTVVSLPNKWTYPMWPKNVLQLNKSKPFTREAEYGLMHPFLQWGAKNTAAEWR
jgi:hypothetical protein